MSNLIRRALAPVVVTAVLGAALAGSLVAPAQAGGPDTHYVYGATAGACTRNLNSAIKLYRSNGYVVTGIHGCRLTGDHQRYFGDFAAYPE